LHVLYSELANLRRRGGTYEIGVMILSWLYLRKIRGITQNLKIRILPMGLCGCKTWSVTLREEHKLREFEERVLRRMFCPKRYEMTGGWRKLHNEELHNLYPSPSIIRMTTSRRVRWAGHVARMGEKMNAYRILVGKPYGESPLGRQRRRWVDNIKMDLREMGWGGMDRMDLAQYRDQ
jgi:hypothetical protein